MRMDLGRQADDLMILNASHADAKFVEARYNELKRESN